VPPESLTSGLYVAGKSVAGFNVREIGHTRDSLAFDDRIVAHPYAKVDPLDTCRV
jgi:hypothetical protein